MARTYEGSNHGIPNPPDVELWRHWGDGYAGRMVGARIQGWDSSSLAYVDVAVDSNGKLLAALAASSIEIGTVDQGAPGATAWKVDGSAVTQPVSAASLPLPAGAAKDSTLTDGTQRVGGTVTVSLAALPALAAGSAVIGHVIVDTLPTVAFSAPQHVIVDSGTENVTLSAETTKVIGTVNQGTSPWVTSRNWTLSAGTDAVSATVANFPAGFANTDDVTDRVGRLLGHVTIDNASLPATQSGSWTLSGSDGLSTLPISARQHNGYTHLYVRDAAAIGVLSELVNELRQMRKELHV